MLLGIILTAIFFLIIGLIFFVSGFSLLLTRETSQEIFLEEISKFINQTLGSVPLSQAEVYQLYNVVVYTSVLIGVLYLATGFGLIRQYGWGRILAVFLCGINAVYGLLVVFSDPLAILLVLVNVIIIWYLMRREVRESFGKKKSIEEKILGEQNN